MNLPEQTQSSLKRLKELERLASPDVGPRRLFEFSWMTLKADNLFLITLITTLICLSCLMVLFVEEQKDREQEAKEKEKYATQEAAYLQTREIPLGSFESVTQAAGTKGNVAVVQFEAFVTTDAGRGQLNETELLVMNRRQRLRSAVELVVQKTPSVALREPSLKTLRNSLVRELNQVVGGERIQDVQFSNFMQFEIPDTKY